MVTELVTNRVPLTFSTLWYQWGLLTIVAVLCGGSKNGSKIFLSITKIRPGHFEVGGFTVVKSKNWPPLIFLKLKFSYINQGPWTWIKRNYFNICHRKKVYLVIDLKISSIWKSHLGYYKNFFAMRDIDVIPFVSCSGTLIYIRKFQFQKNLRWSNFWLY